MSDRGVREFPFSFGDVQFDWNPANGHMVYSQAHSGHIGRRPGDNVQSWEKK